jgi:phage major head subunit gpT-like protein
MKQQKDYIPLLFQVEGSTKAQEFFQEIGELGLMEEWQASGAKVSYEDFSKGFKPTFTHKKYSKGVQVERELLDDDQYAQIKQRIRKLARTVYFTRQSHAMSVFNGAWNTGASYLGADGKPLCSTTHPIMPGSSTTWSNSGTYALTIDNVELTRTAMLAWVDDKGNPLLTTPDTLLVPPALRKTAMVIAETDEEPATTDHGVNVWKGHLNVIECQFLTDSNAWFLCDNARMKEELIWFDRRKPDFADEVDFDTEVSKYRCIGRWSWGFLTPFFVYGNNPS